MRRVWQGSFGVPLILQDHFFLQNQFFAPEVAVNRTLYHELQATTLSMVTLVLILFTSNSLTAQQGIGFESSFGYQSLSGEYGDVLKGGVDAEFSVVWTRTRFRYGLGMDWASYHMEEPNEKESWSNIVAHFGVTFFPLPAARVRPFIQLRAEGRRLRPEGDFLGGGHAPPDEEGENISPIRVFGMAGGAVGGVEIGMTQRSWLRVAGYLGTINTENAELGEIDAGTVDSGSVVGFRVGLFWVP